MRFTAGLVLGSLAAIAVIHAPSVEGWLNHLPLQEWAPNHTPDSRGTPSSEVLLTDSAPARVPPAPPTQSATEDTVPSHIDPSQPPLVAVQPPDIPQSALPEVPPAPDPTHTSPEPLPRTSPAESPADTPAATEAAWQSFDSRHSARGFANYLSAQLDRPFDIRVDSTQRYEVVFNYSDPAERDAVLASIAGIASGLE